MSAQMSALASKGTSIGLARTIETVCMFLHSVKQVPSNSLTPSGTQTIELHFDAGQDCTILELCCIETGDYLANDGRVTARLSSLYGPSVSSGWRRSMEAGRYGILRIRFGIPKLSVSLLSIVLDSLIGERGTSAEVVM